MEAPKESLFRKARKLFRYILFGFLFLSLLVIGRLISIGVNRNGDTEKSDLREWLSALLKSKDASADSPTGEAGTDSCGSSDAGGSSGGGCCG